MADEALTLQEEILLVGLNDTTGKFHPGCWTGALNAAALAELLLCERIVLNGDKVEVRSTALVGDATLDVALCRLALSRRPGTLHSWVRALYRDRRLPFEVLTARLVPQPCSFETG